MNLHDEITPELPPEKDPLLSKATEIPPPHWATIRLQRTMHLFEKDGQDFFAAGMQSILDDALKQDFGTFEGLLTFFAQKRGGLQTELVQKFSDDMQDDVKLLEKFYSQARGFAQSTLRVVPASDIREAIEAIKSLSKSGKHEIVLQSHIQSYLEGFKKISDSICLEVKISGIQKQALDAVKEIIQTLKKDGIKYMELREAFLQVAILFGHMCTWPLDMLTKQRDHDLGKPRLSGALWCPFCLYWPEYGKDIRGFMDRQENEKLPPSSTVILCGKTIPLATIEIKKGQELEKGRWIITDPLYFPDIKAELERLYKTLPAIRNPEELLKTCAHIHWLSANACFFQRGSASIAQLVTAWILEKYGKAMGLSPGPWKKMPDIMAFLTSLEEYITAYSGGEYGGFKVEKAVFASPKKIR